ncbi:molybdopterin-binding protein [Clostridium septicum]|uniref:Molybdopterin molybdenumtransferase n=1 Tax=Clostridium septicum TaxID=1504 RepID=A0A9N7PKD9_CLOSE|nr:molybdopterin-binding protein [Clostridium septicum]AYE35756.1 molybdopterin-binding protein [Clostridium septicum]QAS61095.1 molybdopterin-binding protein [Clostridium septicum]UEC19568.1 molybdopterin-binding protein [Clostridium septicum]
MKMIKVQDAVGTMLSHDVTQIIPGEFKGRIFKKGHIIKEEDIEKLLLIGKDHVYVWEPKDGELHENDAAKRLVPLIMGDGITKSEEIKEGKIDFFADKKGLLKIDKESLLKINSLGEIIVSTIHNNTPIKNGEKIAATRVIPLIIDEKKIIEAEKLIKKPIISIKEYKEKNITLITTGNEVFYGRIKDAFLPVIERKLKEYGNSKVKQIILPDDKERIKEGIKEVIKNGADMVICTGGMSVDPDDVTPTAIKECGGELITYGSPVLPGAMFLLAYKDELPILGIPSCAMYCKRTILDLVLPRILADEKLTLEDIVKYGHGGLCLDCKVCTFPHCSFGK